MLRWRNTVVLLASVFGAVLSCKHGWTSYRRHCYFCSGYDDLLEWKDATYQCSVEGGTLAILDDAEEQSFINESLLGATYGAGAWLGGFDKGFEGDWLWITGTRIDRSKFTWRPGNPDNGGTAFTSENCLLISSERNSLGQLNDYRCKTKLPWICKVEESDMLYDPTTQTPLSTAVTTTCTGCVDAGRDDAEPSNPVWPIAIGTTIGVLTAIVVCVVFIVRRHQRKPSEQNQYEEAQHNAQSNDHKYDSLDQSTIRPTTAHIYTSVYMPDIEPESTTRPNPHRRNDQTDGVGKFGSSYMDVINPQTKDGAAANGVSKFGSCYMDVDINTSDKQSNVTTNTSKMPSNGPTSAKPSLTFCDSGYAEVVTTEDKNPYATPYAGVQESSKAGPEAVTTGKSNHYDTPYANVQGISVSPNDRSVGPAGLTSVHDTHMKRSSDRYGDVGYVEPDIKPATSQVRDLQGKNGRKDVDSKNYLVLK